MASLIDTIKKGLSALNPVGTPINSKDVPRPNPKMLGPKGVPTRDVAEKAKSRNQQTEDIAKELEKP